MHAATFTTTSHALQAGEIEHSSPTLADIDGDGIEEIVIGTKTRAPSGKEYGGKLIVMQGNGTLLWSYDLNAPVNGTPAVGDIDHDGDPEIIVSLGGDVSDLNHQGGIMALDHKGNPLWTFRTVDDQAPTGYSDPVFSSPTLCDVDGDYDLEIAFGGWDRNIYLLDHEGKSLWNDMPGQHTGQGFHNGDTIWSTAACADLNKDGYNEIIIGADITGGGILPDGYQTQNGGFLYVFDRNGTILVRRYLPETVFSSPAVADLDGDGNSEIVVGTGYYWWDVTGRTMDSYVYAFDTSLVFGDKDYSDPTKLPYLAGWPQKTTYPGFSSPALADLDGDGDLEIVIGSGDPYQLKGKVHAWHHTGASVNGWPVTPQNWQGNNVHIISSPTIADIDNDGGLEILFSMLWDIQVYNADGTYQEALPTLYTVVASPAIGDTDGDNKVDIWIGSANDHEKDHGYLWNFESDTTGIGEKPWPMFHRDEKNTGSLSLATGQPHTPGTNSGEKIPGIDFLLLKK